MLKAGIGLCLMLTGLGVTALLFVPYRRAMQTRAWTETPCTITASRMVQTPERENPSPPWRVFLEYRYSTAGREYTGHRWRRIAYYETADQLVSRKTPHRSEAEKLTEKYPPGLATVCYVDPAAPHEAVLEHQAKAAIYTLWWPMIFAVGGAGIFWSALRRR
jgi:Protein of unknown function (DUF3592)